jgi:formylmethanofuran dehydrogenase subunit E
MATPFKYLCPYCGSDDLLQDAYVHLNNPHDVRTFDSIDCDSCGEKDVTPNEVLPSLITEVV